MFIFLHLNMKFGVCALLGEKPKSLSGAVGVHRFGGNRVPRRILLLQSGGDRGKLVGFYL